MENRKKEKRNREMVWIRKVRIGNGIEWNGWQKMDG